MLILQSITALLLAAGTACAASSWSFEEGTVDVKSTHNAINLSPKAPLSTALSLEPNDSIRISLTTTENGKAKRAHQVFVMLREEESGLEAPFALDVKNNGKGSADIPHKDLPIQMLLSKKPLRASIIIGSFGSSKGLVAPLFDIDVKLNPDGPAPKYEKPLRYGKQPEIHHIFKEDARSPPTFISLAFSAVALAALPALFIAWFSAGANLSHLSKAMGAAPISHVTFFGSILAMEGIFFLYYAGWNLFQILPVASVVGAMSFLSGSKALGEVQSRRLAGER